jgi:Histidine kinase-, DNA gyrase B-, and HSP90-like ATPase
LRNPTQTLSKRGEPWPGRTYNCDWPVPHPGYGLAATSFAIALTVWYAGPCPGILAVVLSSLPEQQSDQIFNAFFTTKRQGIGMGLSISRSIVELPGGRLWAEKNTGCGAIFLFSLPVAGDAVI